MRYHAQIVLGELTIVSFLALIEAFAAINLDYRRRNPKAPLLYQTTIKYAWEPWVQGANGQITRPPDIWRDFPAMIAAGNANCKDFVAERLAELRFLGKRVEPRVLEKKLPDGRSLFHAVLEWTDTGEREDPSLQMGMPANQIDLATANYQRMQTGGQAPTGVGSVRASVGGFGPRLVRPLRWYVR